MSLLAINVETVPPLSTVDSSESYNPTDTPLVAIGVGYQPREDGDIDSEVFCRTGSPDELHATATILSNAVDWIEEKNPNYFLDYTANVDTQQFLQSIVTVVDQEFGTSMTSRLEEALENTIDLNGPANAYYEDDNLETLSNAIESSDVSTPTVNAIDYDFSRRVYTQLSSKRISRAEMSETLSPAYLQAASDGLITSSEQTPLETVMSDFLEAELAATFELAATLRQTL